MHRTTLLAAVTLAAMAMPPPGPSAQAAVPPTCEGEIATIVGTPGPDVLRGTRGDDVIVARGGEDRIDGRGGDDVLCGRGASDRIHGGPGDDRILGQGDTCASGSRAARGAT